MFTTLALLTASALRAAASPQDGSSPQPSTAPSGGVNFVIQNQHPANLSMVYANGPNGINPLTSPTLIRVNESVTATFPPEWQGNIQVVQDGVGGDYSQASWMEGNTLNGQVWME
ncbi:MAG: hypothetical protein Q9162_001223 [Coniocarpon cinnabarinum]